MRRQGAEEIELVRAVEGDGLLGYVYSALFDALEGEEELVIKALDDQTVASDLVSSASILGDGRVVLIMNLAAVMDRFVRGGTDLSQSGLFSRAPQDNHSAEVQQ